MKQKEFIKGSMCDKMVLNTIYLPQNRGLGNALREAVEKCSHELIARMDSDDISEKKRFELQLNAFIGEPSLDVVGSYIAEFVGDETNIIGVRSVPENDKQIKMFLRSRCPMNHVSVMYRKQAVKASGGYKDWYCNEDYYLWIRMAEKGYVFANLPMCLVKVRVGDAKASRRGGLKYYESEKRLQQYMLDRGIISHSRFLLNTLVRFLVEIACPNCIRSKLLQMTRQKYHVLREEKMITENKTIEKEKEYPPFSVAMSVYGKDNARWFDQALKSITIDQTVKPNEVVLVVDGPISSDIQDVINKYEILLGGGLIVHYLETNEGLGNALALAVSHCKNEWIARMDSDDVAIARRFEKQLLFLMEHRDIDIVGGNISEFIDDLTLISGKRIVPCEHDEIKRYMKKRCPFNHMTVMFQKQAVIAAGSYQPWHWNEDYYLWIRMAMAGCKFANISENLVFVRVGKSFYRRRGGREYFISEVKLQRYMLEYKIIDSFQFIVNVLERFVVQIMMPNWLREWVFTRFLRQ